ncbi:MAG TPA: sugar ABC transporter substrate-binding protein [Burkholderiales bacterium]|nr:sugar ABC transporter substrate-binding protein [Burkholderiales bacterium]
MDRLRAVLHVVPGMAFLAGGLLLLCAACTSPATDKQTLRFWAMGREGEVVSQLMPEFERRNPGIHVDVQQLPWTAAHEKLLTAFAADALPDVCQLGNTWIPEFAALDALAPLNSAVAHSKIVDAADYFPGIWETNTIGPALLGIPWYVDTRVLFYRKDLLARAGFDHPPRSWNEWEQALAAVKREAGPGKYAILLPINEFEPLLALGLQQRGPLLSDDGGHGRFSSPAFRRALDFYVRMFREQWAPSMQAGAISNVWTEFGRGYFSFYISGPWNIEEFKRRMPPEHRDDWMTAPLPGPDGPGASTAGGASLVIFRSAKRPDAAWRLIEYLSSTEVQVRFHALTGDLPPRRDPWRDPALSGDVYAKAFLDQLERARPTPKVPEWERIANEMQLAAEQVVAGKIDVDQATRVLDTRVDTILEKRRWMMARAKSQ